MSVSFVRHLAIAAAAALVSALPAAAQDVEPQSPAAVGEQPPELAEEWTPWTSGRYRITPGDVLDISFAFVPELNQTVTVQPDGYITLKELPDMRVQGRTLAEVKAGVLDAYSAFVRDPVVSIALKEFEKPYFIASGEVQNPGRYELRGATTLSQALAVAGGPSRGSNIKQVVLLRRLGDDVDAKVVNVRRMLARRDLDEDPLLRPGDTIFVPKGVLGKLSPILETPLLWWFAR